MFADLHLHTRYSDGTYTPEDLVAAARRHGLTIIALTDHDTVEGCAETARACAAAGIEFVPGTELTAEHRGHELHILGYLLDTQNAALLAGTATFQAVRQNRIREIVTRLNEHGVALQAESVFALANCHAPGRPHVARALVAGGFCSSHDVAFERFLKKGRPAWAPKFRISAADAIALIHQAGGVAVIAHPGLNRVDDFIPELIAAGLDGIECFHTKHPGATAEHYERLARRHDVLVTGGSDCHGMSKNRPVMGSVKLPVHFVEKLKARAVAIRSGDAGREPRVATPAASQALDPRPSTLD